MIKKILCLRKLIKVSVVFGYLVLRSFWVLGQTEVPPKVTRITDLIAPKVTPAKKPKVVAFESNKAIGKCFFTTFDTDDGLAMDIINFGGQSAICDSKGNLWFGTSGGGVSRYDGKSFTNFTNEQGLVNNAIRCVMEDNNGQLWFGTSEGISIYNGKTFRSELGENLFVGKVVDNLFLDSKNNIWIGTSNHGVFKYEGNSFTNYTVEQGLPNNAIRSIREDLEGNIWIATFDGLSKYDGNSFTNFSKADSLRSTQIQSILVDDINNIWIGTSDGYISKYDGKVFTNYTTESMLSNNSIYCITQDKNGILWFGTNGGGVVKFDGETFTKYTTDNGLSSNIIRSITEDKIGNIWFGTKGGGVVKYEGDSFITLNRGFGLNNNIVRSINGDKRGHLLFGINEGGFSKYNSISFSNYSTAEGLVNNSIFSLLEDNNDNTWLGTLRSGLIKFDGHSFINITDGTEYADEVIFSLLEDSKRNIWFSTIQHGLVKYDGNSFTSYNKQQGLGSNNVQRIKEDSKGNIWIGTWGGGLSKFDGNSITTYTTQQRLAYDIVLDILEDRKGNIWVGTYGGGINIIRNGKSQEKATIQFETIDKLNGLPNNAVAELDEDSKGNIYVGTNFGLAVIPEGDLSNGIEVYNQFNGYPIRDVNSGAFYCDKNDVLWVGTGSDKTALVRFDYSKIKRSKAKPHAYLETVRIRGKTISWYSLLLQGQDSTAVAQQEAMIYDKQLSEVEKDSIQAYFDGVQFDSINSFYPIPNNLVLPFQHNALTFQFNVTETGRNYMVNYQYKLKGMDDNWSPITKKNEAVYNNLKEGDYVFMLKAKSPEGFWGDITEYKFKVLPPWYRTLGAYLMYSILIILSIWGLIKVQTRKLKHRQVLLKQEITKATSALRLKNHELKQKNEEIEQQKAEIEIQKDTLFDRNNQIETLLKEVHHRVKNNLQVVSSLLDIQSRKIDDTQALSVFSEGKSRVKAMALIHQKLYQQNDYSTIDFEDYTKQILSELSILYSSDKFIETKVICNNYAYFDIDTAVPLGLILNELVTNAFKYAFENDDESAVIQVTFEKTKEDNYQMIVQDNGIGLPPNFDFKKAKSLGLRLVRRLAKQLYGNVSYEHGNGYHGAKFIVKFKNKLQRK